MKLRNKKTGKLGEPISTSGNQIMIREYSGCFGDMPYVDNFYDSLDKVNEEWEDYEEPKEYWFIDSGGEVGEATYLTDRDRTNLRNFGNYFETREEAQKALEKLKAWKRLKDKGFSFREWFWKTQCIAYNLDYTDITEEQIEEAEKDLDLLFGGEE